MEEISKLHHYSAAELGHINRCRLFLKVTTLSDITTACGSYFSHSAYHCNYDGTIPHHYKWPIQPRPYRYARRLWKQSLKRAFPRHGNTLRRPLGAWTDNSRNKWIWFHQTSTGRLFQRYNGYWRLYTRTSRAGAIGRYPRYRYCTQAISLPRDVHRATVKRKGNRIYQLTGTTRSLRELTRPSRDQIENNLVHSSRRSMQETYDYNDITLEELELWMRTEVVKIVSDGSFLDLLELGTAAWILALSRHRFISGQHFTPGPGDLQCSHRSELSGILGAILHVNDLCLRFGIDNGNAELHCDGLGAVNVVAYLHDSINPSMNHFDMVTSIKIALDLSPMTWTFKHVRGHQDDGIALSSLTDWEYWNTLADHKAKDKLTTISLNPNWTNDRPAYPPYGRVRVSHINLQGTREPVCSNLSLTCTNMLSSDRIRNYWQSKHFFTEATKRSIDWEVAKRCSKSMTMTKAVWISKWNTGICGVGKWLERWKWQAHSDCPRCGQDNETVEHVLLCNEISALALWDESISDLNKWLGENLCEPEMKEVICLSLQAWHNGTPLPPVYTNNPQLLSAIRQQDSLTWYSFLCGFYSRNWRAVQRDHLLHIRSSKSSLLWMSKLQRRIWEIPWKLWEHRNNQLHNDGSSIH